MAGPITNDYISTTCKSFVLNNKNRKMIETNFIEIEGTFLVKIRNNAFNRINGENVFEHINRAASKWSTNECIGTVAIWDDLVEKFIQKFYNLFDHNEKEEAEENDDPDEIDNVPEIFKIKDDLFNFDTPFCIALEEFNYLLKIDPDVVGYRELPGMVRVSHMTYFKDHKWYDNFIDGCLKDETLMLKAQIEGSWGDATPGVMKLCTWLRNSFENFHELDYDVLVKLEECQGHMEKPTHEPSTCKIRRFEMTKYSFEADEEYVAIKELEHINHSETNMEAQYAYQELFNKMDDGWLVTRAVEE
ncbi:hypothetical protein Tco_0105297 [Tanacetum coccineum]